MGGVIEAIVDKNKTGNFRGIPIYNFDELKREYNLENCVFVISAPSMRKEIKQFLLNYVNENQIYCFEVEIYERFGISQIQYKHFLLNNKERLFHVYNMWEDDYSREIMMRLIEARLTGNLDLIDDIWENNQYWPENIISFSDREVIVECGSYDGMTLRDLYKLLPGFEHIYCFEPNKESIPYLVQAIQTLPEKEKISIIKKGTWHKKGILNFWSNGAEGTSKLDEIGNMQIEVTTIEDEVKLPVTYIKMDVEGAELNTLQGAKNIIKDNHPKLAVCVYHKNKDMVDIPEFLYNLNPQYKFYLRHHHCNLMETVLYAVHAEEKIKK